MGAYRLDETKELALYTWVYGILGITTIWDKSNAPRPVLPYATLNISGGGKKEGEPEERYKELDTWTYPMRKVLTLTVNIFAEEGHLAYGDGLVNSLSLPTVQDTLRAAGFAIRRSSDVMDISRLLDTKYELRAGVDIFLAYETDVDDVPGEIHRATVTEAIVSEGSNTHEFDIDVDIT